MNMNLDLIVKKPWGHEYMLFSNDKVAVWHLFLKEGQKTSLHCHPNKKTGLIVLQGGATLSFLSDRHKLYPGEKSIIRHGVFHSTEATVGDVQLLEIETPNDKQDLVRLEDNYGREGKPYEKTEWDTRFDYQEIKKLNRLPFALSLGKCTATFKLISDTVAGNDNDVYLILDGYIKSKEGFNVVGPGDVLYKKNLKLMAEKFEIENQLETLLITL